MVRSPRLRPRAWSNGSSGPAFSSETRVARTTVESIIHVSKSNQAFLIQSNEQSLKYSIKRTVVSPVAESLIHRRPWAETFRQVTPNRSGEENSEDASEHQRTSLRGQPILYSEETRSLINSHPASGMLVAPCHVASPAIHDGAILPTPTFCTGPR